MSSNLYQKLYAILCGAASDAIDFLDTPNGTLQAKLTLEQALQTAEELYINAFDDTQSFTQQQREDRTAHIAPRSGGVR